MEVIMDILGSVSNKTIKPEASALDSSKVSEKKRVESSDSQTEPSVRDNALEQEGEGKSLAVA